MTEMAIINGKRESKTGRRTTLRLLQRARTRRRPLTRLCARHEHRNTRRHIRAAWARVPVRSRRNTEECVSRRQQSVELRRGHGCRQRALRSAYQTGRKPGPPVRDSHDRELGRK